MATVKVDGIDEMLAKFHKLHANADSTCKASLYEGMKVVADAVASSARANGVPDVIIDGLYVSEHKNTGGGWYSEVGFSDYFVNEKGETTPIPLVAAAFNSGTSRNGKQTKYPKTGFFRKAINSSKLAAVDAIRDKFGEMTDKLTED